jgi:phosphate transport system ATP-binding protein
MIEPILCIRGLNVTAKGRPLIQDIDLDISKGGAFGLIGPSGAGKSTLLKSINRLVELTPNIKVTGSVKFSGQETYSSQTDVDGLRARIGMLFQQPVVFPTSIVSNVLFGIKRTKNIPKRELPMEAEQALREASLWNEVKDRLRSPAQCLSIGQQQRLCLARALACRPEVLLMDEPTSALDPRSTTLIEELIMDLKTRHTVVLVTHQLSQAARVCDRLALMCDGRITSEGPAEQVLASPLLRGTFGLGPEIDQCCAAAAPVLAG